VTSAIGNVGALETVLFMDLPHARKRRTHLTLFLTPNRMLHPNRSEALSFTGAVRHRKLGADDRVSVKVPHVGSVRFDYHHDWQFSEDQDVRQSRRYLVANVLASVPALESSTILKSVVRPIEDLLLLAAFASRTPTRCAGWLAADHIVYAEYYRRRISLPTGKQRHRTIANGGLLGPTDFSQFLNHAINVFYKSNVQSEIRQSIYALNNSSEQTIEYRFISLFLAFEGLMEGLIADHARDRFAKDKPIRKTVREDLLKQLDAWVNENRISDELRSQFAKQINRVQAISLPERFKMLSKNIPFVHGDLWPIVSTGTTMSLYKIRNLLAHGSSFEERNFDALTNAGHHIEWHLERLLCAVLGWPMEKTDLASSALKRYWVPELLDWKEASRAIKSAGGTDSDAE